MGAQAGALARACRLRSLTPTPPSKQRGGMRVASQKLHRAPAWPFKASRLTWASEKAARSRPFAGREVRCRLKRRAAVASSLQATRANKNPRGRRPANQAQQGREFPHTWQHLCGDARKHHEIAPSGASQRLRFHAACSVAFLPGVPQFAVRLDRTARGVAQGGGLRDSRTARRGTGNPSRVHNSNAAA